MSEDAEARALRDEALIRSTAEFLWQDRPEEDMVDIVAAVLGAPDVIERIIRDRKARTSGETP